MSRMMIDPILGFVPDGVTVDPADRARNTPERSFNAWPRSDIDVLYGAIDHLKVLTRTGQSALTPNKYRHESFIQGADNADDEANTEVYDSLRGIFRSPSDQESARDFDRAVRLSLSLPVPMPLPGDVEHAARNLLPALVALPSRYFALKTMKDLVDLWVRKFLPCHVELLAVLGVPAEETVKQLRMVAFLLGDEGSRGKPAHDGSVYAIKKEDEVTAAEAERLVPTEEDLELAAVLVNMGEVLSIYKNVIWADPGQLYATALAFEPRCSPLMRVCGTKFLAGNRAAAWSPLAMLRVNCTELGKELKEGEIFVCFAASTGPWVAAGSSMGRIRLYEAKLRLREDRWAGESSVAAICFSNTGDVVVVASLNGAICFLDVTK
ncbi:hypothetical protein HK101_003269, partial [Irineochytrium annulatum]